MSQINIIIESDRVAIGKTTIACLIENVLREHGFCDVDLFCRDGDSEVRKHTLESSLETVRKKESKIVIYDWNTNNSISPRRSATV